MADSKAKQTATRILSKVTSARPPSFSRPRVVSHAELKRRPTNAFAKNPLLGRSSDSITSSSSSFSHFKPAASASWSWWTAFRSRMRARYTSLPLPIRRTARLLRLVAPIVPIAIFFSEHVLQIMWVSGPSMTPYLNENYDRTHTESDVILVNLWPWGTVWPWNRTRVLERGMVVTFR